MGRYKYAHITKYLVLLSDWLRQTCLRFPCNWLIRTLLKCQRQYCGKPTDETGPCISALGLLREHARAHVTSCLRPLVSGCGSSSALSHVKVPRTLSILLSSDSILPLTNEMGLEPEVRLSGDG